MFVHLAIFTKNTQKFTQKTQSLRNFRGVDHSKIFELLPGNTHFLLKIRKFYAKYAKSTQNTQNLRKIYANTEGLTTKKLENPCLKYGNFTQNLRKNFSVHKPKF